MWLMTSQGRGRGQARRSHIVRTRRLVARPAWLPLLWGEGRGEGELGRRTDAVGQNGFGMREAEPQILVALDIPVRQCSPPPARRTGMSALLPALHAYALACLAGCIAGDRLFQHERLEEAVGHRAVLSAGRRAGVGALLKTAGPG